MLQHVHRMINGHFYVRHNIVCDCINLVINFCRLFASFVLFLTAGEGGISEA